MATRSSVRSNASATSDLPCGPPELKNFQNLNQGCRSIQSPDDQVVDWTCPLFEA